MRVPVVSPRKYVLSNKTMKFATDVKSSASNTLPNASNVSFCGGMFYGAPVNKPDSEEVQYRQALMDKFFVRLTDENGNLIKTKQGREISVLVPGIKEEMDSKIFKFTDAERNDFEGNVREIIERHVIYDDNLDDKYERMFHGTDTESVKDILKNGPDVTRTARVAFGPGMYFAISEGDAQEFSRGKITADITKSIRKNGEQGRLVRVNDPYYERMTQSDIMRAMGRLLGTEVTGADYKRDVPFYVPDVKAEVQKKVLNEYCRRILVDELGIDAAFARDMTHHTCIVVFNPDSISNIQEYKIPNPYSDSGFYHRY